MRRLASAVPRSRIALVVAFAVIVTGLALVDGLVLLAVEPQLRALRAIANDHARAVEVTTRLRSRLMAAPRELVAALRADARGAAPAAARSASELARVQADVADLLPLADTPREQAQVAALRDALARCTDETALLGTLLQGGDLAGARAREEPLIEATAAVNEVADEIVAFNAAEVERISTEIGRTLRFTLVGATVLTVAGGAAAVLLLRRALRGLAAEESAARARSAELEAFASRAAHELRTPLQTVSLALRALEGGGGSPQTLEKALRSADRLRTTVDGLLEFARAGAAPAEPGEADLWRVADEVREELSPAISAAHAALEVLVAPGTRVAIAATHAATILRNLVGNAVKHGRDGAAPRIVVRATSARGSVHLEVEDDGAGIAPEALPHVFEPFVRATTRTAGHGLGLATVKRLVEAHRGEVRISSAPGRGTVVALDLPAAIGAGPGAPPGPPP